MGATAQAQEVLRFSAQTFRPAVSPLSTATVEGTVLAPPMIPGGSLIFSYAHQPLRLTNEQSGEVTAVPVPYALTLHILPTWTFYRHLAFMADVPVVLSQGFDSTTSAEAVPILPKNRGFGDLRFLFKGRILNNEEGGLGLAALVQLSVPTGSQRSFHGDGAVLLTPLVALDYRFPRVALLLNLGYTVRTSNREVDYGGRRISDLVRYGLGILATPLRRPAAAISLGLELSGAIGTSRGEAGDLHTPLELAGNLGFRHRTGIGASLGVGGALLYAPGSPVYRMFAGLSFEPQRRTQKPTQGVVSSTKPALPPNAPPPPKVDTPPKVETPPNVEVPPAPTPRPTPSPVESQTLPRGPEVMLPPEVPLVEPAPDGVLTFEVTRTTAPQDKKLKPKRKRRPK